MKCGASRVFKFAEFELDEGLFELRRGRVPVPLQPKALETILYLIHHRDRLVNKEELLHGPWAGLIVSDAAISQAVKLARRALGDGGLEQRVIRTVRGKGFRFVAAVSEAARRHPPLLDTFLQPCAEVAESNERGVAAGRVAADTRSSPQELRSCRAPVSPMALTQNSCSAHAALMQRGPGWV